MNNRYADVIVDISHEALDKVFQYRVPLSLQEEIQIGSQVLIPFGKGNREIKGYVIGFQSETDYDPSKIKEIIGLFPGSVRAESELIQIAVFLKTTYGSSMAQALRTVLPVKVQIKHKEETTLRLACEKEKAEELLLIWQKRHYSALSALMEQLIEKDFISKRVATGQCKVTAKKIRELEEQGIIKTETKITWRNPWEGLSIKKETVPLNEEQIRICRAFRSDYDLGIRRTYLLHGVTGSGKTEVYLDMIDAMIEQQKQSIVLIPEISLTFQTVRRFYERFGEQIAVMNSKMSKGERYDAWERVKAGQAKVVIGARSALFAPVQNLGLIIIDEEHDGAYKSDTSPKYHARETAIYRAMLNNASVVLGSATPSVEAYYRAMRGEYQLWKLNKRAKEAMLPAVQVVNLKEELENGNRSMFSAALQEQIRERLDKKEQIILFLNRRGYSGFVSCRSCGNSVKCPHCDVSLTYHRNHKLVCHYCGYQIPYVKQCPTCHSNQIAGFGLGTEKVESALYTLFPEAKVLRMDADTTRKKHSHEEILRSFENREADILLGTQMIVKGHDYENVTLVGILAADMSLQESDYRSAERTFQLLCQAAGRAGRGAKPGNVIIQTYVPEHYAIEAASIQSYDHFYQQEIQFRSLMGYPPCGSMLVILIQSRDERSAVLAQMRIVKMLETSQEKEEDPVRLLNPGAASIGKVKDIYRRILYLKHKDETVLIDLKERLAPILETHELFAGVSVSFDLNPMNFY